MARRRYQRGSLVPTSGKPVDGLWRARWREDEIRDGEIRRVNRWEVIGSIDEFPTRRLAERRLEEILRPINSRSYRATEAKQFKDIATKYLKEAILRPSVKSSEKSRINNHLTPFFGCKYAHEITPGDVRSFIASAKCGPKTVKLCVNTLRQIFKLARDNNYMTKDVDWFGDVKLPEIQKSEAPYFTEEEMVAIIQNADGLFKTFYWILGETGIRLGECCALQRSALWLERQAVVIKASAWLGRMGPTKNGKQRVFPISSILTEHLRPILEGMKPDAYLFSTKNNTPWNGNDLVKDNLTPLLVRLKIKTEVMGEVVKKMEGVGAHAFRHGNVSLMIKQGHSAKVIQDRVGHSSFQRLSLETYGHASSADHVDAAERLGQSFALVQ